MIASVLYNGWPCLTVDDAGNVWAIYKFKNKEGFDGREGAAAGRNNILSFKYFF